MNRRNFLRLAGASACGVAVGAKAAAIKQPPVTGGTPAFTLLPSTPTGGRFTVKNGGKTSEPIRYCGVLASKPCHIDNAHGIAGCEDCRQPKALDIPYPTQRQLAALLGD